jgi:nitrogen fixation/metabolism regulation signal transduction histidine kinase
VAILGAAVTAFWVSDRIGRPVGRLVRAVDAIAGGEADYTFPGQARDELEELAEAFSRMQRRLELQLQRSSASERVAAWREVARHVAHEVKNPLAPIRLTVENLMRARRDAPELFEGLFEEGTRTILEEVEQLRRLVEEFSEFARLPAPRPRPVDLHRLLDEVVELYSGGGRVEIERDYAGVPIVVQADSDQLARAMKNIVANAVEAMDGADVEHPRIGVRTSVNDGRVTVEIHDNGPGISSDAENKVFEPYFTTRREGTGLGMAIVYRIVTEHGGVIEAGRAPGGGAAITVQLPIGVGAVKDEGSG